MEILVFGHAGTPILAFPSSMGRFHEWEDFGMVDALHDQLSGGHNVLVCLDSVDHESLYNRGVDPHTRVQRHRQYEQYVFEEALPFARHRGGGEAVIAAGASFGAFHAANLTLKRPWDVVKLVAMSGAYDIRSFLDGYYGDDVYFSNPVDYLPGLDDPDTLGALRDTHLILTAGEHDPCRDATEYVGGLLADKGAGPHVDLVPGAFGHDWPWWREQMNRHLW
jgi:esterase/lipase superfamily enzyme